MDDASGADHSADAPGGAGRSVAELRALRLVSQLLDPRELDAGAAEHLLAVLHDPGDLVVVERELNLTVVVVDLEDGVGRIEDLIAPDHVTVAVPELVALLRDHLIALGRDPAAARRQSPRVPGRRWITAPGRAPEETSPPA
ncbi:hypothetical protein [Actinomycetospora soli]|uniref:hypothetical protein n=1 Tax=Actinomycetospora soli TaxID=2893887 RepID=UPI001E45439E|nr:hypothetical protein [Actinomycetospora soli]MCD2191251.1 hypothetical protein [Actinomycetospora soli]